MPLIPYPKRDKLSANATGMQFVQFRRLIRQQPLDILE